MINKDNFVKYINKLKKLNDIGDAINSAAEELESFTVNFWDHEELIINILCDVFDDGHDGSICYFIYDLEFGNRWKPGMITDKDGKDVRLSNAEELYDELVRNMD